MGLQGSRSGPPEQIIVRCVDMDNKMEIEDITYLLKGLTVSFNTWKAYKESVDTEKPLEERPPTSAWINDLAWAAQWRASLEYQLKSLRRMVGGCIGYLNETWTLEDLIRIMEKEYAKQRTSQGLGIIDIFAQPPEQVIR